MVDFYEIDKKLLLRKAKKKSDVVRSDSFVRILKPKSGLKSAGYIVQLLKSNQEFYCDNLYEYGGYFFATTVDSNKIAMIDPNSASVHYENIDRLDIGPDFAIAVTPKGTNYDKNIIIKKDGTRISVDREAGFYGDFNKPETIRFKDQFGNLSKDFFVDIYGRVLAGGTTTIKGVRYFEKLNTPGLMAYDIAGREFKPKDTDKLNEAQAMVLFNEDKIKLNALLKDRQYFEDETFANAIRRILTNKFNQKFSAARDNKTKVQLEDAYKAAQGKIDKLVSEIAESKDVEF